MVYAHTGSPIYTEVNYLQLYFRIIWLGRWFLLCTLLSKHFVGIKKYLWFCHMFLVTCYIPVSFINFTSLMKVLLNIVDEASNDKRKNWYGNSYGSLKTIIETTVTESLVIERWALLAKETWTVVPYSCFKLSKE